MRTAIAVVVPKKRIGVNVVCLDSEKHILLLKHVFHPLAPWGLPGGWMDRNESPAECALRELREETGIDFATEGEVIQISRNPGPDHINIVYLAHVDTVKPTTKVDGSEITESRWITPTETPDLLTKETVLAIEKAWASHQIPFNYPEHQIVYSSF